MKRARYSSPSVIKALQNLEEKDYIIIEELKQNNGDKAPNRYIIVPGNPHLKDNKQPKQPKQQNNQQEQTDRQEVKERVNQMQEKQQDKKQQEENTTVASSADSDKVISFSSYQKQTTTHQRTNKAVNSGPSGTITAPSETKESKSTQSKSDNPSYQESRENTVEQSKKSGELQNYLLQRTGKIDMKHSKEIFADLFNYSAEEIKKAIDLAVATLVAKGDIDENSKVVKMGSYHYVQSFLDQARNTLKREQERKERTEKFENSSNSSSSTSKEHYYGKEGSEHKQVMEQGDELPGADRSKGGTGLDKVEDTIKNTVSSEKSKVRGTKSSKSTATKKQSKPNKNKKPRELLKNLTDNKFYNTDGRLVRNQNVTKEEKEKAIEFESLWDLKEYAKKLDEENKDNSKQQENKQQKNKFFYDGENYYDLTGSNVCFSITEKEKKQAIKIDSIDEIKEYRSSNSTKKQNGLSAMDWLADMENKASSKEKIYKTEEGYFNQDGYKLNPNDLTSDEKTFADRSIKNPNNIPKH